MPSKKKILFVITKSNWGGAQRYVYDLATNLPKEEFEPIVALGGNGVLKERLKEAGIRTKAIHGLQRDISLFKEVVSFFHLLWLLGVSVRPDVVHLNSSKAAGLGALAARIARRKKIIFSVHGWPFKEDRGALTRFVIYILSWLTAVLSHEVVVETETDGRLGKRMWFMARKIRVIPPGLKPPSFLDRDEVIAALILTPNRRIITIAELTPNKGIRYGIEAVADLVHRGVDVSYYVISTGEQRTYLEALARSLGVGDHVHFLGFVPDAAQFLKGFDVFLLPSLKEGMPYVLLEALAAGLPLVTTTAVDAEFVASSPAITAVPPKDPIALSHALQDALKKDAPRTSTSEAALFGLTPFVEKIAQLYTAQ